MAHWEPLVLTWLNAVANYLHQKPKPLPAEKMDLALITHALHKEDLTLLEGKENYDRQVAATPYRAVSVLSKLAPSTVPTITKATKTSNNVKPLNVLIRCGEVK